MDTLLALHTASAARMAKHEELLERTAASFDHLEEQGSMSKVNSEEYTYKLEERSKPRKGKMQFGIMSSPHPELNRISGRFYYFWGILRYIFLIYQTQRFKSLYI